MILSMTGYGKSTVTFKEKKINVEIKSLNSKSFDLSTRITPLYREKEIDIRKKLSHSLIRGKIDFSIWIEKDSTIDIAQINTQIVEDYYKQIKAISAQTGIKEPNDSEWYNILLRLPDITTKVETETLSNEEWDCAEEAINQAINSLVEFRTQEGLALEHKFKEKIDNIENLLISIEPYETSRVPRIKEKIIEELNQIPTIEYDTNRLEQELIYYIEKLDISEECQRLSNHLKYFRKTMEEKVQVKGKKLGFIAQEIGREINTTGSKSNQADMQKIVVMMKDELEQIKEQVLNAL